MCELLLVRNQPGEDALSNGLFVWSQCAVSPALRDAGKPVLESILGLPVDRISRVFLPLEIA